MEDRCEGMLPRPMNPSSNLGISASQFVNVGSYLHLPEPQVCVYKMGRLEWLLFWKAGEDP